MNVVSPASASVPTEVFQALNLKYRSRNDPSAAPLTRPGPSIARDRPDMPTPLSLRERPSAPPCLPESPCCCGDSYVVRTPPSYSPGGAVTSRQVAHSRVVSLGKDQPIG